MKITPQANCNQNITVLRSKIAQVSSLPLCTAEFTEKLPDFFNVDSKYYIANSNINFSGIDCSPKNFRIKSVFGLDCPSCGIPMLTQKQANLFVSKITNARGKDIEEALKDEYIYLRKNEQVIADILINDAKIFPNLDLAGLITVESAKSIEKLKRKQKEVLYSIRKSSYDLCRKDKRKILKILKEEEKLINESDDYVYFKRKDFIAKIESFRNNCKTRDIVSADVILQKAYEMPDSGTNRDAFFVKYSRKTNSDIAKRLVSPAVATTEHIIPQSKDGENNTSNYIPLCGNCNSGRGDMPYSEWFNLQPEMPENLQRYILQASKIINNQEFKDYKFYDTYIDDVIEAIEKETNGKLKLKTPEEFTS